ncbi:MAG: hypothetical protein ABFS86_08180 [Planctomycetota bacterium]
MAKREKKPKKEKSAAAAKQEIDAVKGFIFVMILLIVALGVFIVITKQRLTRYDDNLAYIKGSTRALGLRSLEVEQYLALIGKKDETVLLTYPSRFFQNRYRASEVGVLEEQVEINKRKTQPNRKERYTEISWTLDIKGINRDQASKFLWGVEERSAKARTIELSMRRDQRKSEGQADFWNGTFKIGYRKTGLPKRE